MPPLHHLPILLLAMASATHAQIPTHPVLGEAPFETEPDHVALEKLGQWPGYVRGFYREITSYGRQLFVAAQNGGMHTFDLDDPMIAEPVVGSRILDSTSQVVADGNRLYALDGQRFEVFEIAPSGAPDFLGGIVPDSGTLAPRDFAVADGYIYLELFRGMGWIDSRNVSETNSIPATPERLYDDNFSVDLIHRQGQLLLGSGPAGIRIFDIAALDAPVQTWEGLLGTGITDIDGAGERVVLASRAGLIFASLADPTFPQITAVAADALEFQAVAMSGTLAVGLTSSQIHAFDLSDPTMPRLLGSTNSGQPLRDVTMVGDYAYIAAGSDSILVLDLTDELPVMPPTAFTDGGSTTQVEIDGTFAYVADGAGGVVVLDIRVPSAPVERYRFSPPAATQVTALQISNDRLYIGVGIDGTLIYDLADPAKPTLLGETSLVGEFKAIDKRLYVVQGEGGLVILDTSNPAAITELGRFTANNPGVGQGDFRGIEIVGPLAYIASGPTGIHVIEINDPASLKLRGIFDIPDRDSTGIEALDGYLFVQLQDGDDEPSTEIFAIHSTPLFPLSERRFDTCCDSAVSGRLAFMSDGFSLHALDILFPDYPVSIGGYDTFGQTLEIEAEGDLIYVANGAGGLLILEQRPFVAQISNPRFDPGTDDNLLFDVQAPRRNLFRVRSSTALRAWEVPGTTGYSEKYFTGTGSPFTLSSENDLGMLLGPRHFYHLRGGAGLILDPFYAHPEELLAP